MIFERFERGPEQPERRVWHRTVGRAGSLCAAMGGTVSVDSAVGAGATFTVMLPRRPDRDSAAMR